MQFKPWQQQLWISFKRMGGCALCRDSSPSTMEHPGTQGWPHPLKAQGLKYHIAKICFPHTAAASSIFRGKKPSCVCPEPSSQQDSLFSWHLPDTSPSLKVGPVLSVFPKFPLSSLPASYRHKLGNLGRGKTPALHHTSFLHNFLTSRC